MKLANNFLSATAMVATSEAVVMGVKSGLDPAVMIDVINSGSGLNTASRDKFPRSVLPRSFDFGFATGLMVKDVRLCLEEMKALGLSMEVAEAVGRLWEVVIREMGPESDFTAAIKPIEKAAGVVVGRSKRPVTRRRNRTLVVGPAPIQRAPRGHGTAVIASPANDASHSHGAVRSIAISVLDLDARAHHRILVVLDQHFRHQRPRVVGAGLHRAIGAGGHDRQQIAGLRFGQLAVEREVVAGFADRADHVGDDRSRALWRPRATGRMS